MTKTFLDLLKFGDLNPATHPNTGKTLDQDSYSGIDNLADAARKTLQPSLLKGLSFPLKGIILKEITGDERKNSPRPNMWQSWISPSELADKVENFIDKLLGSDNYIFYRVMVPEIHSHLPVPKFISNEGSNSEELIPESEAIIRMYPIFVYEAGKDKSGNTNSFDPGDICYVDFGERVNFQDPYILGRAMENKIGTMGVEEASAQAPFQNDSCLKVQPPPGERYGSGQSIEPEVENGQSIEVKSQTPVPVKETCDEPKPFVEIGEPVLRTEGSSPSVAYLMPVKNATITSAFGKKRSFGSRPHSGMDLIGEKYIYAPVDATVIKVDRAGVGKGRFNGNAIKFRDAEGFTSYFLHLKEARVRPGQKIKRGDIIGIMGNTGASKGIHLHWQFQQPGGKKIDPLNSLKGRFSAWNKFHGTGFSKAPGSSTDYPV